MKEKQKILILGAAKSGLSVAKLLAPFHHDITISDLKPLAPEDEETLKKLGVKVIITDHQEDLITADYDLIIKNPAIKYTSPLAQKINDLKINLTNEVEVAYHFLPKDVKIIGITGSNGKTTVTTMIYELLKQMGLPVVLGGNIGTPLAELVSDIKSGDILVLELSDHQLNDLKDFKTDISVLTNISPAHLDYHGSFDHYKWAKKKIFNHHTKDDIAIINANNADSMSLTQDILSHKIYFNDDQNYFNETGIWLDDELVLKKEDILLQGNHNYENILATLLVVKNFGWDLAIIKKYLATFGGVEHRLEFVREVNQVQYYNDSKATSTAATITALKTFTRPVHLILGGEERGQDFHDLDPYMNHVTCLYAIGSTTARVGEYGKGIGKDVILCQTLNQAMKEIIKKVEPGDVVLLSPASASQDFYARFEDRGNEFKNFVAKI